MEAEKINKIEIIPAILPDDFQHLSDEIESVYHYVDTIQIDVTDGKFAPSTTWPYKNEEDEEWKKLVNQETGLPQWEKIDFEIDLMVEDQLKAAHDWISAGVSRIIIHVESMSDESFAELRQLKEDFNVELILALSPSTPGSILNPHLSYIDGVQFMGNDKIGYHGVELDMNVLDKIKDLREKSANMPISIDIGVNFDTIPLLAEAGVTRFASGSLILNSENPGQTIEEMKRAAE